MGNAEVYSRELVQRFNHTKDIFLYGNKIEAEEEASFFSSRSVKKEKNGVSESATYKKFPTKKYVL